MKHISTNATFNPELKSVRTVTSKSTVKVGSYAQFSSINARPWATTPARKGGKQRAVKRRRKKKILHPVFAECANIATDPFWKDKFEKASYGKFPRGFSYNNDCLMYKRGAKNNSVLIPETPYEAYSVSVFFFHDTAKIYSDQDRRQLQEEEYLAQLQDQLKEKTWAKTLKRQKEVLVEIYVRELSEKHDLSREATLQLEDLINIGILFNHFNKDTIVLQDGMISEIKGLVYDPHAKRFTTKEPLKPKTGKSSSKAKKIEPSPFPRHVPFEKDQNVVFLEEWNKFLDQTVKPAPVKDRRTNRIGSLKIAHVTSPSPQSKSSNSTTDFYSESTFTPLTVDTLSTTE